MKSCLIPAVVLLVATAACSPPSTTTTTTTSSTPAAAPAPAPMPPMAMAPPTTDEGMIQSAMSAAPEAIAKDATVITMEPMDNKMGTRIVRKGTNGWTCMPDSPSPGPDPMCVDQNGAEWLMAWLNHTDPPKGKMGFGYMLMGGSDASNTDPFLMKAPDDKWVDTGPHVMVLNIGDSFAGYPTTAGNTKAPYIMFPKTPYAHLMLPIK